MRRYRCPQTGTRATASRASFVRRPGSVFVGRTGHGACPLYVLKGVPAVYLVPEPGPGKPVIGTEQVVNGLVVMGIVHDSFENEYTVPALGVQLTLVGPKAQEVLSTLTWSPRAVVLAEGPAPKVPPSWQRLSFAGIEFSAPPTWPVTRTNWGECGQSILSISGLAVTFSNDIYEPPCPVPFDQTVQRPTDGLRVDVGPDAQAPTSLASKCLDLQGLRACPGTDSLYSVVVLSVKVSGPSQPVIVSIGLAGSGMVARTILYSLRPASDSAVTPASFLARAKAGIEGTFSAVYRLSAPSSSTENDATVTVAQRAASGSTSWPGGKPGEWWYRLTYADDSTVEWLVRGNLLVDCWRVSRSKWRCSAGDYNGDAGSIGYTIATIPYLPGTAFLSLSIALQAMPPHASLAVRSEQSSFGPLTCVRDGDGTWCLMRDGHLATWTGLGFTGYSWTNAQLVSEQPTAPATDSPLQGSQEGLGCCRHRGERHRTPHARR